jgi:hypothetical protein
MVTLALILPALWDATTGPGTVTTPERTPLVFAAREGWRARLMYLGRPRGHFRYAEGKWEAQRALKDPQVMSKAYFAENYEPA